MSFETEKSKLGKIPVTVVEVDLDKCVNTYGVLPCTASAAAGGECFNTRATCQDAANYDFSGRGLIGAGLPIASINVTALAALSAIDVAFIDSVLDELRTYRFIGSSWSLVGSGLSISGIGNPALAALNSTDVAFIDDLLEELRVYRFNGSTWSLVGSGLSIPGISFPALTALNSTDVAFIDRSLDELRVYRFNGSTWSLVGSGLSISGSGFPALAALNSTDVAFIDDIFEELRLYRFNGSAWSLVGSGFSIPGVSSPALANLNATDVAFFDATLDELRIYRFDGSTFAQVGSGLAIAGADIPALTALNSNDVAFIDNSLKEIRKYRFDGSGALLTHKFKSNNNNDPAIDGIPCLVSVSTAPTKIVIGKGLGHRASITIQLMDFTHHDRGIDPYVSTRTYDPETQGTYFGKLKARNPFYTGRKVRIKTGFNGEFQTRLYIIESMSGPDESGRLSIVCKDPLKLADKERSQCPALSTGELASAYSVGGTTLVLTAGDGAGYPASGTVRIGDNILAYTGVSTDTLTGVTGGQWGTTDAAHDAGSKVQLCKTFSSVNVVDIIEDLLLNFTDIDAAFIDSAAWALERDMFLSSTTLTSIISEPTGVKELIEELTEQFLLDVWWSDDEQLIKLESIIPKAVNTTEAEYTDEHHILKQGVQVSENIKDRVTEVWFYYAPINHSESYDAENMAKVKIVVDANAESAAQFNDKRIKKIFSRWTDSESLAIQSSSRLLNRDATNRKQIKFKMDVKDSSLKTGDHFIINTKYITDETGAKLSKRMQVLSHDIREKGVVDYDTIEVNFTGRYMVIAPNTVSGTYSTATTQEKAKYGFVGPNSGNFPDGEEPYKII